MSSEKCVACGHTLIGVVKIEGEKEYHDICFHELKYHSEGKEIGYSLEQTREIAKLKEKLSLYECDPDPDHYKRQCVSLQERVQELENILGLFSSYEKVDLATKLEETQKRVNKIEKLAIKYCDEGLIDELKQLLKGK